MTENTVDFPNEKVLAHQKQVVVVESHANNLKFALARAAKRYFREQANLDKSEQATILWLGSRMYARDVHEKMKPFLPKEAQ